MSKGSWKEYPYGNVPEGRKKKWYAAYIHAGYAKLEEGVSTPKKPKQSWKKMVREEADRVNSRPKKKVPGCGSLVTTTSVDNAMVTFVIGHFSQYFEPIHLFPKSA
jgi:hypothetical protein